MKEENNAASSPHGGNNDTQRTLKRQRIDGNAFESTRGLMLMFWDIASTIAASPRKTRILRALNAGELDQRNIARLARLERANAQRALAELCEAGLAECLTPHRPRAKIYRMTKLGKQIHDVLQNCARGAA